MSGDSGIAPQTTSVRCVLWHSGAGQLPGELLTSLSKRVGRMLICTDLYAALAEACLIERDRRAEQGDNGRPAVSGILLLVDPRGLAGAADLIEAAKTYAPNVARWWYDHGANPRLRAVVDSDVSTWQAHVKTPTVSVAATPAKPAASPARPRMVPTQRQVTTTFSGSSTIAGPHISPKLRLAGIEDVSNTGPHDAGSLSQPTARPGERVRPMPLLTEAELSMLLSDEPLPEERNGTHDRPSASRSPSPASPSAPHDQQRPQR